MPGVDRVIAGTSGSPGSLRALRYAEVLARAHDAALVPVIAWVPPEGDRAPGFTRAICARSGTTWPASISGMRSSPSGERSLTNPRVQPHVERGAAGWVLVSIACRAGDLLVVGAGRRGALARTVSCQVSRYCVAHAQCPVLTVPPAALAQDIKHGRLARALWHRPGSFGTRTGPPARGVSASAARDKVAGLRCGCLGLAPGSGCSCWRSPVLPYSAV